MIQNDLLADLILILHFIFVLVVIVPVPFIIFGKWRNWRWIKNRAFRITHLSMMMIVMMEAIVGIACPLTVWEQAIRKGVGDVAYQGSFVAHWVGRFLYYDFEPWVFTLAYLLFGLLIVGLYFWVPPRTTGCTLKQPRR